jgi:anti-sigma B factor antagonist
MPGPGESDFSSAGPVPASGENDGASSLPMDFEVVVEPDEEETWVRAGGELDIYTSPRLMEAINEVLATKPGRVCLAMERVSFIDSSAISVLVRAQKEADLIGCRFVIHSPARSVMRTLDLAGLKGHLLIEE